MTTQNYLIIEANFVTNVVSWDGNTQTWQPPQGSLTLIQATTPTKIWGLNTEETEYFLVDSIGDASPGFTWDGSVATTGEPQPEPRTPVTE
jgi:hypothetical protein